MASIERQQVRRRCLGRRQIGDQPDALKGLFAGLDNRHLAFDQGDLGDVGEVQIRIQRGGGADRSFLDPAVAFIDGAVPRGKASQSKA